MKNLQKKLTAWLLIFTMVFCMMPVNVWASEVNDNPAEVSAEDNSQDETTAPADDQTETSIDDAGAEGTDTPATDDTPADDNSADEPTVDEPAVDEPTVDEPTVDEPTVDEPTVDEPTVDEPAVDEPTVDEPAVDEPTVDEPTVDEPTVDEPTVDEPAVDEPTVDEPTVDEPTVDEPAVEEPTVETPPVTTPEPQPQPEPQPVPQPEQKPEVTLPPVQIDMTTPPVQATMPQPEIIAPVIIPAEVTAFVKAVDELPDVSLINAENAAEIGEQVNKVLDMYEGLIDSGLDEYAGVNEAIETVYAIFEAVLEAANIPKSINYYTQPFNGYEEYLCDTFYYNGQPEAYLYLGIHPNSPKNTFTNPAETLTVWVSENGNTQRLYTHSTSCRYGHIVHEETPEWIAVEPEKATYFNNSNPEIVQDITWALAGYIEQDSEDSGYGGFPALEISFTGQKPGNTTLRFSTWQEYYYNFYNYYGYYCNCGAYLGQRVSFSGWIEDKETLNIKVNARYQLNYDSQGGSAVSPTYKDVADITATLEPVGKPTRTGYIFKGWAETPNATAKDVVSSVTLNWQEGQGSQDNPVSKTLYAVWEEVDGTPTAPGYDDLFGIMKKFVKVVCVSEGEGLPHAKKEYSTVSGNTNLVTIGSVRESNNEYYCDITTHGEEYAKLYGYEPIFGTGVAHTLADNETKDKVITLKWNSENKKWENHTPVPVVFNVVCKTETSKEEFNVTYTWNGLPDGHNQTLPTGGKYAEGNTVNVDTKYTDKSEVTVNGKTYVFSGWTTFDPNVEVTNGSFTMPKNDVTISGTWTEKQYNVTYAWSGLPEGHNQTLPTGGKYAEGNTVNVDTNYTDKSEVTVNGKTYVFSGWTTFDHNVEVTDNSFTMPKNDVTISGTWSAKQYNVTYAWNGLPEGHNQTLPAGGKYAESTEVKVDETYPSGKEVRVGNQTYVFSGWTNFDPTVEVTDNSFTMPGQDVTINGTWSAKQYNVTYEWSGLPDGHKETLPAGGQYAEGAEVNVDGTYTDKSEVKIGDKTYVFSGWEVENAIANEGKFTMPGQNVVIKGVWTEKGITPPPITQKFNVRYEWTGLPDGHNQTLPAGGSYAKGDKVTVNTSYTNQTEVVENGKTYIFSGWDKTDFTMPENDVIIKGSWSEKITYYTVTYTDGVDGEEVFADQVTGNLKYGDTTPAFNGTPTREGYRFTGWNPQVSETVTGNAIYVAQWTPDGPTGPTDPTEPTNPTEPENPGTPDDGGSDDGGDDNDNPANGGGDNVNGNVDDETIPLGDAEIPLATLEDEEVPMAMLEDDEVPLAEMLDEDETLLDEPEVPLANVPKTGDNLLLWFFATAISGLAALVTGKRRK